MCWGQILGRATNSHNRSKTDLVISVSVQERKRYPSGWDCSNPKRGIIGGDRGRKEPLGDHGYLDREDLATWATSDRKPAQEK